MRQAALEAEGFESRLQTLEVLSNQDLRTKIEY